MNYTTIEQSKHLLELGLDASSADMFWRNGARTDYIQCFTPSVIHKFEIDVDMDIDTPCWSVGRLIELMPSEISTGNESYNKYQIRIRKYNKSTYQIAYGNNKGLSGSWHDMINTKECDNLIDACIETLALLLENGYIKKGE